MIWNNKESKNYDEEEAKRSIKIMHWTPVRVSCFSARYPGHFAVWIISIVLHIKHWKYICKYTETLDSNVCAHLQSRKISQRQQTPHLWCILFMLFCLVIYCFAFCFMSCYMWMHDWMTDGFWCKNQARRKNMKTMSFWFQWYTVSAVCVSVTVARHIINKWFQIVSKTLRKLHCTHRCKCERFNYSRVFVILLFFFLQN